MQDDSSQGGHSRLRKRLYVIIFGSGTPAGKLFDVILIAMIVSSVAVVMLDSVTSIQALHGTLLYRLEWFFTLLFSAEYLVRLYCAPRAGAYARSFLGIVDLAAVVPTYLSLLLPGSQYLLGIRLLRVLRIFRVLKITPYIGEAHLLMSALRASRRKITVFVFAVLTLSIIFGSVMYVVEGPEHGFTSIPKGVYWSIVTLTTVGYGDVSPGTPPGQFIAVLIMIMGYGIIAVPTGIVTVELAQAMRGGRRTSACPQCETQDHDGDALYCKHCGHKLA